MCACVSVMFNCKYSVIMGQGTFDMFFNPLTELCMCKSVPKICIVWR